MREFFYRIFEIPFIYNLTQKIIGGKKIYNETCAILKNILHEISYTTILDLGCGTGIFRNTFNTNYVGVDINPQYIEYCKKKYSGTFLVNDATSLTFSDNSFDLVSTITVLHHLDKGQRNMMLCEMKRVCEDGGVILIIDGLIPTNKWNVLGFLLAKLDRGKYKMYYSDFMKMIYENFDETYSFSIVNKTISWSEMVFISIKKNL